MAARCFSVVKIWCAREQLTSETNVLPRHNSHQPHTPRNNHQPHTPSNSHQPHTPSNSHQPHTPSLASGRVGVWDVCTCVCGTPEESQPLPDKTRGWAGVGDTAICLVLGFCGCHQHCCQKQVGEEGIAYGLQLSGPTPSPKEVRTQAGQEPRCRRRCRGHGGVLLTGLLPSHGFLGLI